MPRSETRSYLLVLLVCVLILSGCPLDLSIIPLPIIQAGTWSNTYGVPTRRYLAGKVVEMPNGGYLAKVVVEPIGVVPNVPSSQVTDFFAFRVDQNGKELWSRNYEVQILSSMTFGVLSDGTCLVVLVNTGSSFFDNTGQVILELVDKNGQLLWDRHDSITGALNLPLVCDGTAFVLVTHDGSDARDLVNFSMVKRDRNWGQVWSRSLDKMLATHVPEGFKLIGLAGLGVANDGSCVFTVYGTIPDPSAKTTTLGRVLLSIGSDGEVVSVDSYASSDVLGPVAVFTLRQEGGYIVEGGRYTDSPDPVFRSSVALLDRQLDVKWVFDCPNGVDVNSVTDAADGGVVLAGDHSTVDGTKGTLIKLDSRGQQVWTHDYCIEDLAKFYDIAATSDGGFIATGESERLVQEGEPWILSAWLLKLDAEGKY